MQKRPTRQTGKPPGSVRIIAGEWRGRRIEVAAGPGIRPTPDRVRETLFNWLAPVLPGMHCLDLYAGTGVLGPRSTVAWCGRKLVCRAGCRSCPGTGDAVLDRFTGAGAGQGGKQGVMQGRSSGRVLRADARRWLAGPVPRSFDLVFLDPPYQPQTSWATCVHSSRVAGWPRMRGFILRRVATVRAAGIAGRLAVAPGA
jgi:16S rRNA (guanine966-N2)-methyltransferase